MSQDLDRACAAFSEEAARWRAEVDDADDDGDDDDDDELQFIVVLVVGNSACMQVEFQTSQVDTLAAQLAHEQAENSLLLAQFDAAVALADRERQRADAAEARLAAVQASDRQREARSPRAICT